LEYRLEATALFVRLVRFRCEPEPGGDNEEAGAREVLDYELGSESSELIDNDQTPTHGDCTTTGHGWESVSRLDAAMAVSASLVMLQGGSPWREYAVI
jgi:hypothetical protein